MKAGRFIVALICMCSSAVVKAQNITYSEIEKADGRNLNFEILGNFSGNYLVYKNLNKRQDITIYNNDMTIKDNIKLDFISDKTNNIDFVTYPNAFIMVWQFQKGNVFYCKAAKMDGNGQLIGTVQDLDTTKLGFFSNSVYYHFTWSEDKKKLLLYKTQNKNDDFNLTTKVYNDQLILLDSSRKLLSYNNRREDFGELQIDNAGNIIFFKVKENAREEYINTLALHFKKLYNDTLFTTAIPLDDRLIQEPNIKIDNLNAHYVINTFLYKKNNGNVEGLFTAVINQSNFTIENKAINIFDDSVRSKLSGKPDWRSAFDDFQLRNIILRKDGGFIAITEEYYRRRRFGSGFDDRYYYRNPYNQFYASPSDYYLYNRGYYGYYRPYNDGSNRDIIYNYNDVINFSFNKNLQMQWNSIINKTTSDVETDNFLSFANMNAGAEIYFLFLQKDNNRQILSCQALQADGTIIRYATLKSRENGYNFMPRLARQTGYRQMIVPCTVRNNIAFAKIDF
ncbi:hypothetical protein ACFOWM_11210 [Ferruginibacter yonginensis]|uniref:6-bladed beta-propeller protein n=1 Tax=Ferruginibacter yonginensis TaxID=1310416 RepID=A0ABV8QUQ0_9BACT